MRFRLEHLVVVDVEDAAIDLVHGEEARGHAAAAGEEYAPADPELLRRPLSQLLDPHLDAFLLVGLGKRHVLPIRDHLRRYGQVEGFGLVRPPELRQLPVTDPYLAP